MFRDFRHLLDHLEESGKLLRVKKEVDPCSFEIAAAIRKVSDTDGPALLFENIKGYPGWRIAGGIYATQKLVALGLRTEIENLFQFYLERTAGRIKPKMVSTGPVKEVVLKGADVDIMSLPLILHSEKDAGPFTNRYITAGVQVAKWPGTEWRNTSMHRVMPLSRNTMTLWAAGGHLRQMINAADARGESLGVATVIGAEPCLAQESQLKVPAELDEMEIAGAFRGAPLELVKCETIDVEVPANAEIVIECVTTPGERHPDGPFGEKDGTYGGSSSVPVVKVTAITMRRNPIYQALLTGLPMTENHRMKEFAIAAIAYEKVKELADIKAINITPGGCSTHHVVVAVRKHNEMEPRNVIQTLLASRVSTFSRVVVVDTDIDVYNPVDVEWAICTRVQPDRDILIFPSVVPLSEVVAKSTSGLALPASTGSKWGIDATMSLENNEAYRKVYIPGQEKVDWL